VLHRLIIIWQTEEESSPERKSFSIISNELLAGPRVASCFVAFLNLMERGVTPMDGSIAVTDICSLAEK
jgi:hypothetical protein